MQVKGCGACGEDHEVKLQNLVSSKAFMCPNTGQFVHLTEDCAEAFSFTIDGKKVLWAVLIVLTVGAILAFVAGVR